MHTRRIAMGLAAALAASLAPFAAAKGFRRAPQVVIVETPLGRQGDTSRDGAIVIPFVVADVTGRLVDVEVQYGVDSNADNAITEDEYRPAAEDRFDPRNTRRDVPPQLYTTAPDEGATHAYVWKSLSDFGNARLTRVEYALTPQGRPILDPDNPGRFLQAIGPDGLRSSFAGVRVRARTVLERRGRRRTIYGAWAYTEPFDVDNTRPPAMTIDSIEPGSPLLVHWSVWDPDSEDFDANGQLDVSDGEDVNGDGKLDAGRVGVAFDFHIVWEGEDPASMTDLELSRLSWIPCTRVAGVGDTDSLDARPGDPVPETGANMGVSAARYPPGRHWVFAWDPVREIGTTFRGFILRATPFDETRAVGKTVYSRTIVYESN